MKFRGKIIIKLKESIKDVRGITIEDAAKDFLNRSFNIRTGAYYEFSLEAQTQKEAKELVNKIVDELLCNPITEFSEILWEN